MEARYKILERREATYLVLNRILLTNTKSKSSINFSIKNLIQDKTKALGGIFEDIYLYIGWNYCGK